MFQATKAIYDKLIERGDLKVFTEDHEEMSEAWLGFNIKNGQSIRIRFMSLDDSNSVAVRVMKLASVNEESKVKLLPVINDLNAKYRFAKFVCDSDGDVNVEYDFTDNGTNPSESAFEMVVRFVRIIEEVYPVLMRAIWA